MPIKASSNEEERIKKGIEIMKKTLAIILSVLMVLCMMPSMAFAADQGQTEGESIDLANVNIADIANQEYTGAPIDISSKLKVTSNNGATTVGNDAYVVEYSSSTATTDSTKHTDVGTVTIKLKSVEGKSTNESSETTFSITPKQLTAEMVKDISPQPVGEALKANEIEVSHKLPNGNTKTLTEGESNDYIVNKPDSTASGLNTVTITGKGNYTGIVSKEYYGGIDLNKNYDVTTTPPVDLEYSGNKKTCNVVTVKAKTSYTEGKETLKENEDYIITYIGNVNAGQAQIIITGINNYAGEIVQNAFYITAKPISKCKVDPIPNAAVESDVVPVVRDGNTVLKKDVDYTYSVDIGKKIVNITGKGNYKDNRTEKFSTGTAISNAEVRVNGVVSTEIDSKAIYTYNGSVQKPKIDLYYPTYGSQRTQLVENRDYKLDWENTINASNTSLTSWKPAKVTITGLREFAGKMERTYIIKPVLLTTVRLSMSSSMAYIPIGDYSYTSNTKYMPEFTVYDTNGKALVRGTDYYVYSYDYKDSTKTAVNITLRGKGNYDGFYYGTNVVLNGTNMAYCRVELSQTSYKYTGYAQTPTVKVYNGSTLVPSTYYIVSYKNNKEIGTASVTVTGTNGYTGSQIVYFTITGNTINTCTITLSPTKYTYDGTYKRPTVTVKDGYTVLRENTDYTLSYDNNRVAGTATVTIRGKGKYSGTVTKEFTIQGLDQTLSTKYTKYTKYLTSSNFNLGATANGDGTGFTYTSSDTSVAKVSSLGEVEIVGTGIAEITVATKGTTRYNPASKVVKVTVKPKKPAFELSSPGWGKAKVRITKVEGATKYQIKYGRQGNYKNVYVTHDTSYYATQSKTIKGLQSGKTYYIKVRSYKTLANGDKVWGNWTATKKIRVR